MPEGSAGSEQLRRELLAATEFLQRIGSSRDLLTVLFAAALLAASVAAVGSLAMPLLRAEIEARWTMRLAGRIASRGTA